MKPTVFSLFSGIGGIDLAFERAGFQIVGQVEIDEFCQRVLYKHWSCVPKWGDVRKVRGSEVEARLRLREYAPTIDVIAGGFPCQDISISGKREGIKEGTRSGLWYEFARLIGELQPKCVFLENVANIVNEGGIQVISDLTALGYDCEWGIVPAAAVGAPHTRNRWFCVAYANRQRPAQVIFRQWLRHVSAGSSQELEYTNGEQCEKLDPATFDEKTGYAGGRSHQEIGDRVFEPRMGRATHGLSFRLDSSRFPAPPNEPQKEWEAPRTIPQKVVHHNARLRALGNAVVPQVVYPFAVAIRELLQGAD